MKMGEAAVAGAGAGAPVGLLAARASADEGLAAEGRPAAGGDADFAVAPGPLTGSQSEPA